ncbi:MAG: hypothetical protein II007_00005 [Gammaproteobacteria bacterium]|nr:hypothetical protein [Gammaproteobacteria bacterium]
MDEYLLKRGWSPPKEAAISSSNWRGYLAKWEISRDKLLLKDVTIRVRDNDSGEYSELSLIDELFKYRGGDLAYWYTGALILPQGKMVEYVHMGYGSRYERYRVIRVARGYVLEDLRMSGEEFEAYRTKKFEEFMKQPQFEALVSSVQSNIKGISREQVIKVMKDFYAEKYLSR